MGPVNCENTETIAKSGVGCQITDLEFRRQDWR